MRRSFIFMQLKCINKQVWFYIFGSNEKRLAMNATCHSHVTYWHCKKRVTKYSTIEFTCCELEKNARVCLNNADLSISLYTSYFVHIVN